ICRESARLESVLDVGTGTGVFAEAFGKDNLRVAGIDPDTDLLAVARKFVPRGAFQEGVAEKLPFPDASFDLVFLGHVLHEADDPVAALAEARRVARRMIMVLEWPYLPEDKGPPLAHRLPPERVGELARSAGIPSFERITLTHMELFRALMPAAPSAR
ncbi:MAG TPA: class I SAM-dependent methyltransferase, partial [bacterium]|nr:class I SAM-dependent methyltransferase [bacterium]